MRKVTDFVVLGHICNTHQYINNSRGSTGWPTYLLDLGYIRFILAPHHYLLDGVLVHFLVNEEPAVFTLKTQSHQLLQQTQATFDATDLQNTSKIYTTPKHYKSGFLKLVVRASSKICWWSVTSIFGGQVKFEILVSQGQPHFWISEMLQIILQDVTYS
jgi:hypothetical protein